MLFQETHFQKYLNVFSKTFTFIKNKVNTEYVLNEDENI